MPGQSFGSHALVFDVQRIDETVIVDPSGDLGECDFERVEDAALELLELLDCTPAKNVVIDFHRTSYYGSSALALFVKLWKRVRSRNGRMAVCNVSENERAILEVTRLAHLWPICASRDEALDAVSPVSA